MRRAAFLNRFIICSFAIRRSVTARLYAAGLTLFTAGLILFAAVLILSAAGRAKAAGERAGAVPAGTGFVLCAPDGQVLAAQHPDRMFIPASILKVFTALAALQRLGPDFRYQTAWAIDPGTRDLFIKGFGDPLFISEVIRGLSKTVAGHVRSEYAAGQGDGSVHDIILDHSFFDPEIVIPGTGRSLNPYDATSGALCANFNTIAFTWDAALNAFISAEPQTPLLPVFLPAIRKTGQKEGRITLNRSLNQLYPGYLVAYFLQQHHVRAAGNVRTGEMTATDYQVFTSPYVLTDLIQKLMTFSNNFMANQIMLTMGAREYGGPATLSKGIRVLEKHARDQLGLTGLSIAEGSGISRENRITPMQMIRILEAFRPWHHLLKKSGDKFYKTGTLSGIRTRAGYIDGRKDGLYPFVIMVNRDSASCEVIMTDLIRQARQAGR